MKDRSKETCIDFVVTWVDDSDPVWRAKRAQYVGAAETEGNTEARYRGWDTLKYWFRGVEKFAPWVRYVYFISDDQKPEWLNVDHPKLKWVKHSDFIPEEFLPTFHSKTIEWNMYRISELSESFVYFNDDMFLIKDTCPEDFFVNGLPCDAPQIDYLYPSAFFSNTPFNNTILLNRHFSLRQTLKKHWKKWLRKQSFKNLAKILFFGRKDMIPGTGSNHIHISYRKDTFCTLWEQEPLWLHETCTHKQRTRNDVSHWCARDWQLFTGEFYPQRPIGKAFSTATLKHSNEAINYLRKQKGKVICLNDSEDETEFELHKKMIIAAFEDILPEKSAFEL